MLHARAHVILRLPSERKLEVLTPRPCVCLRSWRELRNLELQRKYLHDRLAPHFAQMPQVSSSAPTAREAPRLGQQSTAASLLSPRLGARAADDVAARADDADDDSDGDTADPRQRLFAAASVKRTQRNGANSSVRAVHDIAQPSRAEATLSQNGSSAPAPTAKSS
eukprot:681557-Pleurochrysis_carterae.AAC.1